METTKLKKYKFITVVEGTNFGNNDFKQCAGSQEFTELELNSIYESISIDKNNLYPISEQQKLVNLTYGEMTFEGVAKMIKETKLESSDIFYDLGSGNGKAIIQVFMNGHVKEAHGIEFHPERFFKSQIALKRLYKIHPEILDDDRIICYGLENIKDVNYLDLATVIFMCSTCYPGELLDIVYDKIKSSKSIRCVITQKEYKKFKDFLPNERKEIFPCTWNPTISWYIYEANQ